jgi:hypothetical protein
MTDGLQRAGETALQILGELESGQYDKAEAVKRIIATYSGLELGAEELANALQPQLNLVYETDRQRRERDETTNRGANGQQDKQDQTLSGGSDGDPEENHTAREARRGEETPRLEGGVWVFPGLQDNAGDPDVKKTQDLVRAYAADLAGARTAIMGAAGAPALAESVWTSILKHGFVDLNKINGGNYSAVTEEDGTDATIGDYVLKLRTRSVTNPVVNFMDWSFCWESYSRAVEIAFPHRKTELQEYGDKIRQLFKGFRTERHSLVLNLDRAIRTQVANNYRIKLTDEGTFTALSHQYLSPHGLGYFGQLEPSPAAGGRRNNKIDEPCKQWNGNRCARPDNVCKYKHQCSNCRGAHTVSDCPKTASGTGGRVGGKKGPAV